MGKRQQRNNHKMRLLHLGLVLCLATAGLAFPVKEIPSEAEELTEETATVEDDKAPLVVKDDKVVTTLNAVEEALIVTYDDEKSVEIKDKGAEGQLRADTVEKAPLAADENDESVEMKDEE